MEHTKAGTEIERIFLNLFSLRFIKLLVAFGINYFMIYNVVYFQSSTLSYYIETPTKTIKPFVNNNFLFFLFAGFASSLIYTATFVIEEKYRVELEANSFRKDPISTFKQLSYRQLLINATVKAALTSFSIPFLYNFFKYPFFYLFRLTACQFFDLNRQMARTQYSYLTFFTVLSLSIASFVIFDLLSKVYDAYASIGCLIIDKQISSLSKTPFPTLITGLQDEKHPFVRLTAFQELLFMVTTEEVKIRDVLYRADNWTVVLEQLALVLSDAAKHSRLGLPRKSMQNDQQKKPLLFGGMGKCDIDMTFDLNDKSDARIDDITVVKSNDNDLFQDATSTRPTSVDTEQFPATATESLKSKKISIKARLVAYATDIEKRVKSVALAIDNNMNKIANDSATNQYVQSLISSLTNIINAINKSLYGNVKLQATKRIRDKYLVEVSIWIMFHLMVNSKVEDEENLVGRTFPDVLLLLTKVVKGTGEFVEYYGNWGVAEPVTDKKYPGFDVNIEQNDISDIRKVSFHAFYNLVVFYNGQLNDYVLHPEVFGLAKWCTDRALELENNS
ncbi:Ndc1 protein [Martiniozyma asiatica (nom. inval.)]|nr:Ndc1 protein [Martiniozyma asiatica]